MEAEDPLVDLADIHLPGPVSFWPLAPGWWVLAAVLVIVLILAGIWYVRRWQRLRRLGVVLQELQSVYQTFTGQADPSPTQNTAGLQFLHGCNEILKRVALIHFPHDEVASLNGTQWLRFLDRTGGGQEFTVGDAKVLGDGSYRREFSGNARLIHDAAARWIRLRYQTVSVSGSSQPDYHSGEQTA